MSSALLSSTIDYVKGLSHEDSSGHDWWHIYRVWKNAMHIAQIEGGNLEVIELAALLHDIDDWKQNNGDTEPHKAKAWLEKMQCEQELIDHIVEIIRHVSYRGAEVPTIAQTLEGMIVQDADRLDAIGAIGIARTFAYGGHKGKCMYDPEIAPQIHTTFEAYQKNTSPTINHFYEKLLLLKDRMNTETAKKISLDRHRFMENYLEEFYQEWEGKK